MDNLNLNKHISGQFNAELESIRTQVMTMGGMVEQQLSDAITAMHNQDSELAKRVIEGDHNVNMMEVAIDEACVRIIAKRQPTASDLRLVMAIIKTIAELERIGDVADKICRTALEKFSQQHQPLLVSLESRLWPGAGGGVAVRNRGRLSPGGHGPVPRRGSLSGRAPGRDALRRALPHRCAVGRGAVPRRDALPGGPRPRGTGRRVACPRAALT